MVRGQSAMRHALLPPPAEVEGSEKVTVDEEEVAAEVVMEEVVPDVDDDDFRIDSL